MLLAAALGSLVGLVLALTGAGAGGAILAVPLLIFSLGRNQAKSSDLAPPERAGNASGLTAVGVAQHAS